MVAAQHHQPRAGIAQGDDEAVVLLARVTGRGAGIEHVTSHQHRIHPVRLYLPDQPVQKRRMFSFARLAEEVLPQVEIGGVQQTHMNRFPGKRGWRKRIRYGEERQVCTAGNIAAMSAWPCRNRCDRRTCAVPGLLFTLPPRFCGRL